MNEREIMKGLEKAAMDLLAAKGYTRQALLEQYGGVMMIARSYFELTDSEKAITRIDVCAREGVFGVVCFDFELFSGEERAGSAVQYWALVSEKDRKALRFKPELPYKKREGGIKLTKLRLSEDMLSIGSATVTEELADKNGHLNNAEYLPLALNAWRRRSFAPPVRELWINYEKEAPLGTAFEMYAKTEENSAFIKGVFPDGTTCFSLKINF